MKAFNVLTEFTSDSGEKVVLFNRQQVTNSLNKPVPEVTIEFSGFTYHEPAGVDEIVKWLDAMDNHARPE